MTRRQGQRLARWALVASLALVPAAAQSRGGFRTWAREMVEQMAGRFALTESQKQQALVVYMKVEDDTRPLEMKIGEQRMALREAVKNSSPEWQIDQMAGAVGALTAQVTAIETKGEARFYALLNAEQRQKWGQSFRGPGRGPGGRPGIPRIRRRVMTLTLPMCEHRPLLEADVVERAKCGDAGAFNQIVSAYRKRVFGTVARLIGRPEDVEDVAQEIFVRLYHSLGQLRSPELFEAWLNRIVANTTCDYLRRKKRSREVCLSDLGEEQTQLAFQKAATSERVRRAPSQPASGTGGRLAGEDSREGSNLARSQGSGRAFIAGTRGRLRRRVQRPEETAVSRAAADAENDADRSTGTGNRVGGLRTRNGSLLRRLATIRRGRPRL